MARFGERLRELREAAKITMKQLADELGCSVVYVSDVERGRRNPPAVNNIIHISSFLRVNDVELLDLARIDRKRIELELEGQSKGVTEAGLVFARSWRDLSEEQANKILEILKQGGDI